MTQPLSRTLLLLIALSCLSTTVAQAADWERNPLLEDRFKLSLGVFVADVDSTLAINGSADIDGSDIDFSNDFGLKNDQSRLAGAFTWRFGEKWNVSLQYFDQDLSSTAVLDQDVSWGDFTLEAGSSVTAGTYNDIYRLFFGRKFHEGEKHEFGAGLGLHYMEIGAFAEGDFVFNGEPAELRREQVSAAAPLPNIGAWYYYAWSKRWGGHARLDWFSANIDEYSGSLVNAAAGVSFQASRHFAIGLDYYYFDLDVDVDSSTWVGSADLQRSGPFLHVTANW